MQSVLLIFYVLVREAANPLGGLPAIALIGEKLAIIRCCPHFAGGLVEILTFLTVLMVIMSVGLVAVVIMQSGRSAGLSGAITGGAEAIFGKKKGLDDFLARLTVIFAVVFFLSGLAIAFLER